MGLLMIPLLFKNALNISKKALLISGKTYLAGNLNAVPLGSLKAVGGRAIIKIKNDTSVGLNIKVSNFELDCVDFNGGSTAVFNVESPTFGTKIGVYIGNLFGTGVQLQNISVSNSEIYGCDYAGLYGGEVQIGFVFGHRVTLHNVNCHHNYINMFFDTRFEYTNATLCYGYNGYAGIIVAGGNNKITSSSFENNWENCQLTTGENDSHGGFVNCSFNHAITGG